MRCGASCSRSEPRRGEAPADRTLPEGMLSLLERVLRAAPSGEYRECQVKKVSKRGPAQEMGETAPARASQEEATVCAASHPAIPVPPCHHTGQADGAGGLGVTRARPDGLRMVGATLALFCACLGSIRNRRCADRGLHRPRVVRSDAPPFRLRWGSQEACADAGQHRQVRATQSA